MNNIKKLRKEYLKLSQTEFGEKIGVSRSVINNLERGLVELKDHMIKLICQTFNVNEEWLRNGTEPIFNQKEDNALKEVFEEHNLSEFMQDIVTRYLELEKPYQEAFETFLKGLMKNLNTKENDPKGEYGINYKTLTEEENERIRKEKRKAL